MFAHRLKQLRKDADLTQKGLAEKLNLTQSTIAYYENGRKMPTLENAKLIAKLFSTGLDYLLGISNDESIVPAEKEKKTIPVDDGLTIDIDNLSPESREDLKDYIKLLKLRDIQKKNNKRSDKLVNLD